MFLWIPFTVLFGSSKVCFKVFEFGQNSLRVHNVGQHSVCVCKRERERERELNSSVLKTKFEQKQFLNWQVKNVT